MKSKPVPNIRNRYLLLGDLILIVLSVMGSYALRFELGNLFFFYLPSAYWMAGAALIIKPLVYYFFGMYRRMWIYASTREVVLIVSAVATSSVILSAVMVALASLRLFVGFPRPVLVFDFFLSVVLAGGLRFVLRLLAENRVNQVLYSGLDRRRTQKVLIVGAGDAGALVVRELQKNPQLYLTPVGFLDDNPSKLKQQIYGVPVIGTLSDLTKVIDQTGADQVIIAIPSAPGRVVRLVAEACRPKGIPFRTMPGIYELLGGKVSVSRLREVDISDLLRREPAHIEEELVGATLGGRVVLVTGAGGSIGRELCRQIARWGPSELIVLGHGENSIFETLLEIEENFPSLPIIPIIADIRDLDRLNIIFDELRPQVVFHTAAHKHVPLMEEHPDEAVRVNVLGTVNVVDAACHYGADRFVFISTDKAVNPTSIMGATKRLGELLVSSLYGESHTRCTAVRFGNVLGSRGSVVPTFERQIDMGGPLTVTHPEMTRYFMSIGEAVSLTIQAATLTEGGDLFVLDMGEQVRIEELALRLVRLRGLRPGVDIPVKYIGIRPGEKLREELLGEGERQVPTAHPAIFRVCSGQKMRRLTLRRQIEELIDLAQTQNNGLVMAKLWETVGCASMEVPHRVPAPLN
uniref:Polysaccharide biosynthesis protein n=1 Tax=Anaerolinea thermolimosa TaxID=229919 RepID=A0A7C4PGB6_9CHLR